MFRVVGAVVLLCVSASVQAITWHPTDINDGYGDVNSLLLSSDGPGKFAIFDGGSLPAAGAADLLLGRFDRVTFSLLGDSTWELQNRAGDVLNIGADTAFHFGYFDGVNWVQESLAIQLGSDTNIWFLRWGRGASLIAVDVAPIPLPASVWLMASALALLGLRRSTR